MDPIDAGAMYRFCITLGLAFLLLGGGGAFAEQMALLLDMGLSDVEANARELAKHNGDIEAAVTALLMSGASLG